jgi:hypothetical protein
MRSLKRFALVLWLAVAVLAGQQLVLWHDLGHATDHASHDPGHVPSKCEQHSACVQLGGALAASEFVPVSDSATPPRAADMRAREASLAPRRGVLSRAPPTLLA